MADPQQIERECLVFSRYLSGVAPDAYVRGKYAAAFCAKCTLERSLQRNNATRFDELVLQAALIHPWFTRAMDIYSRFFYPHSGLRKRLILLLAIMESWAPAYDRLDRKPAASSSSLVVASVAVEGLLSCCLLTLALPVMLPLQVACKNKPSRR